MNWCEMYRVTFAIFSKETRDFVPDFPDSPEKELFVLAVLFNRRELAKLFWRLSKDHIGNFT